MRRKRARNQSVELSGTFQYSTMPDYYATDENQYITPVYAHGIEAGAFDNQTFEKGLEQKAQSGELPPAYNVNSDANINQLEPYMGTEEIKLPLDRVAIK